MKKSFIMIAAVSLGLLTACDPIKDEATLDVTHIAQDQLLANATFKQFAAVTDDDGNITGYKESADGNYIEFNIPGVTGLNIFTLNSDGSEKNLQNATTGTFTYSGGGMFILMPRRGSDPNQTVYFRYINQDGESVTASKDFNVAVPSDIAYELKLLCSNDYGEKVWTWDTSVNEDGAVWGNMGYLPGDGPSVGTAGNGKWWGVTSTEDFADQLKHSEGGVAHGDGDLNAYMVFNEDGTVTSYAADGTEIRKGTFKVEGYTGEYIEVGGNPWKLGDLVTDAILWPWVINTDGTVPSKTKWTNSTGGHGYEIVYLTPDKLTLVYPGGNSATGETNGSWAEATYWHFKSSSDLLGMAAGYDKGKDWTWDDSVNEDGAVWGNMGYLPGDGASVGTAGNGKWWGVTSEEDFQSQLQHTSDGAYHGDGSFDAYMTIGTDGLITSYGADGSVIRKGTYEFKSVAGSDWKIADLKTDAILWPWIINTNGKMPSEVNWGTNAYEVVYLTNDKMTLVYPGGNAETGEANGSWAEATYWHFKAK